MPAENPYRVTVVCTGNICRSPMGEAVLRERFEQAGLAERVEVDSAGTHDYQLGQGADPRTVAVLRRNDHPLETVHGHVAHRFEPHWLGAYDLVLAADAGHQRVLRSYARDDAQRDKVRLLRSFDPDAVAAGDLEMDDPYYGRDADFDQTYAEIDPAADGVVAHVRERLDQR